jgi:Concanavalin A-like lectin/glucanases superfamily
MGRPLAFATCLSVASSGCLIGIDESLMAAKGGVGDGGGVLDGGPGTGDGGTGASDGGTNDRDGAVGGDGGQTIGDPTLLGAWSFEDQSPSSAVDSSGHGHDATLAGSPTFVPGHAGHALHLTASNAMSVASLGGGGFPAEGTLVFWTRVAGGGIKPTMPAYGLFDVEDDARSHFTLRPTAAGGFLNLEIYQAGIGQIDAVAAAAFDDAWTHVVVTWSTSGQKLAFYTAAQGATFQRHLDNVGADFSTAEQLFHFGTAFAGDLDEVRLYSVILDETTIAALP